MPEAHPLPAPSHTPLACAPTCPAPPPPPQHARQRPGQEPQQASARYGHGTRARQHRASALAPRASTQGNGGAAAWPPVVSTNPTGQRHTASQHGLRADDGCPRGCPPCANNDPACRAQRVMWARGVVVSHPLSMREALGSIPSVSSGMKSIADRPPLAPGPCNMHLPQRTHEGRP